MLLYTLDILKWLFVRYKPRESQILILSGAGLGLSNQKSQRRNEATLHRAAWGFAPAVAGSI
jgi:hypothetical protein